MATTDNQLVKQNNEKRKLLTEENKRYYQDLIVYIRTHWRLSEKQTEEVLMEMLDHLLDAQAENKTAEEIFGADPLKFANELIEEIATEKPRDRAKFIAGLAIMLGGWVLLIRAFVLFGLSRITEVQHDVYLFNVILLALLVVGFVISNIWFILRELKRDLFQTKKRNQRIPMMKTGAFAGSTMVILLLVVKFTPQVGPSITFAPLRSFVLGLLLLVGYYGVKLIGKRKTEK